MKHGIKITIVLVLLFLATQVMGLVVTEKYLTMPELPLNLERPEVENESMSFIPLFLFILAATVIGLLLIRFNLSRVWKAWFLFGVLFTLIISFSAFVPQWIAIALAAVLAILKVVKHNVIIHNFTELFIYGALAAIFVPILNVVSALVLLLLISVYDFIAVRKTKHMVKLAKFEGSSKVFAGLFVPYKKGVAVLGGGDMGFPLLFAGVVMKDYGLGLLNFQTYIIPVCTALALLWLLWTSSEKKFYPAMPYISLGCVLGYILVMLV